VKKPNLSFGQILNMSFGFLGIQFGFALQNANVSRIFQTLGAEIDDISILWIAAPLTGLIVQPIIGYFSDRTWTKLGRRRPYFLFGAIFATLALFIMPNSPVLWVAAGMLWIMDASINVSMEPFRAFVGDNLNSEQRTMGFAVQSFFIGIGAVVASMLPYILDNVFGVSSTAPEGIVPDTVKWSFYLGGIVFLLAILWTVVKSKEYSPEELAKFEEDKEVDLEQASFSDESEFKANGKKQMLYGALITLVGAAFLLYLINSELDKNLYVLAGMVLFVGILLFVAGLLQNIGKFKNGFVTIMNDFQFMPKTMKQLAGVQFFSWFALFAMWIYTTASVTNHIYGSTDPTSVEYNQGADWVGVCFAVYNGIAALVAFLLPKLAKITSRKMTHFICLVFGGIGLMSIFFISNPTLLMVSMVGVGIAWASILSMPYAMLTGSLPANKMGYYMGVFNFFIVIPQLLAAAVLGFFLRQFFDNDAIWALILGGISMVIAGILTLFVEDKDDVALAA
jgi:maltose/moltooligosaccharide transporter